MVRPVLIVLAIMVGIGMLPAQDVAAAPSVCTFPNTSARATKVMGNGPAACALSVCRTIGRTTTKVVPCADGADPSCANQPPYVEQWRAESGGWGALPACPTWTNTSVWQ